MPIYSIHAIIPNETYLIMTVNVMLHYSNMKWYLSSFNVLLSMLLRTLNLLLFCIKVGAFCICFLGRYLINHCVYAGGKTGYSSEKMNRNGH